MLLAKAIELILSVVLVVLALFELGFDLNTSKESSVNVSDWPPLVLLRVNVVRGIMQVVKAGVLH